MAGAHFAEMIEAIEEIKINEEMTLAKQVRLEVLQGQIRGCLGYERRIMDEGLDAEVGRIPMDRAVEELRITLVEMEELRTERAILADRLWQNLYDLVGIYTAIARG